MSGVASISRVIGLRVPTWKCALPAAWLATWLLVMGLYTSNAQAFGALNIENHRCVLRIGPYRIFFTGFQPLVPQVSALFCDIIWNTGQTVFSLDMPDTARRDMLIEIRVIKDDGKHSKLNGDPFLTDGELASPEVLDPLTIVHVSFQKYPTGTLTFEHSFPETGKFIGIVTVKNKHGQTYVSQFPFPVQQWRAAADGQRREVADDTYEIAALAEMKRAGSNVVAAKLCKGATFSSNGLLLDLIVPLVQLRKNDKAIDIDKAAEAFIASIRESSNIIAAVGKNEWCAKTLHDAKESGSKMLTEDSSGVEGEAK